MKVVSDLKALVVEVEGKYAIVLDKDGTFKKIKNNGKLSAGSETDLPVNPAVRFPGAMRTAAVAAAFVIVAGIGFGAYSYATPYSYIEMDINPSVEITANRYDRILQVKALNDDGKVVIGDMDFKNKSLSEGVKNIVGISIEKGYLKLEDANSVLITVSSGDEKKTDKLEAQVEKSASIELKQSGIQSEVVVEKAPIKNREDAMKEGVTPGKLNLLRKLNEAKPEVNPDDYKGKSTNEIMKEIKEAHKNQKSNSGKADNDNSGREQKQKADGSASKSTKAKDANMDKQGKNSKVTIPMVNTVTSAALNQKRQDHDIDEIAKGKNKTDKTSEIRKDKNEIKKEKNEIKKVKETDKEKEKKDKTAKKNRKDKNNKD